MSIRHCLIYMCSFMTNQIRGHILIRVAAVVLLIVFRTKLLSKYCICLNTLFILDLFYDTD